MSLMSVVYCQVDVSATGRSLTQMSPTECGVSECNREASKQRKPRPTSDCRTVKNTNIGVLKISIPV